MKGTGLVVLKVRTFTTAQTRAVSAPSDSMWVRLHHFPNRPPLRHKNEKLFLSLVISAAHANRKPQWRWAVAAWGLDSDPQPTLGWRQLTGAQSGLHCSQGPRRGTLLKWPLSKPAIPITSNTNRWHLNLQDFLSQKHQWMLHTHTLFKAGATDARTKWNSRTLSPFLLDMPLLPLPWVWPDKQLPNTFLWMSNPNCAGAELVSGK